MWIFKHTSYCIILPSFSRKFWCRPEKLTNEETIIYCKRNGKLAQSSNSFSLTTFIYSWFNFSYPSLVEPWVEHLVHSSQWLCIASLYNFYWCSSLISSHWIGAKLTIKDHRCPGTSKTTKINEWNSWSLFLPKANYKNLDSYDK